MKSCLMVLRMLVGFAQSALMLGGCAGLLMGSDLFSFCVIWFLILCAVQVGILILAVLFAKVSGDYTE